MNSYFKNMKRPHGQSIIEYSVVIILVAASLITMGPYVQRSWNAHVKSLEDSVSDSQNDPLIQAAVEGDIIVDRCLCAYEKDINCLTIDPNVTPNACCGIAPCNPYQAAETWNCIPNNCAPPPGGAAVQCYEAAGCCDAWVNTLNCGSDATNAPPPSLDGTCPDGQMEQTHLCGNEAGAGTIQTWRCNPDFACNYSCLVTPDPPAPLFADLCIDSSNIPDDERLAQADNGTRILVATGSCTDGTKCEYECMSSFFPTGAADCRCAPGKFPMDTCGTQFVFAANPLVNNRVITWCSQPAADQFCLENGSDYAQSWASADSDSGSLPGYPWGTAPCSIIWNGTAWVNGPCTNPARSVCYNIDCASTCLRF